VSKAKGTLTSKSRTRIRIVISSGVKVLVLAVIVGIGSTLFAQFTAGFGGNQPTIDNAMAMVLGARVGMQGRAVPWSSRVGRRFSGFWVWASGGPVLSDSQSGFRVYPVAETLALATRARRFEFEVEVLVQASRADIPLVEVPVPVSYAPPGGRVSHFRPWRDFGRNAATFTRLIATRLLSRRRLRRLPRSGS